MTAEELAAVRARWARPPWPRGPAARTDVAALLAEVDRQRAEMAGLLAWSEHAAQIEEDNVQLRAEVDRLRHKLQVIGVTCGTLEDYAKKD